MTTRENIMETEAKKALKSIIDYIEADNKYKQHAALIGYIESAIADSVFRMYQAGCIEG